MKLVLIGAAAALALAVAAFVAPPKSAKRVNHAIPNTMHSVVVELRDKAR